MDILNLIFGIITLLSFAFSIYTYYKTESKKEIEAAKSAMIKERLRNIEQNLIKTFHSVDMMVQLPKKTDIAIPEMQNLARLIRADLKLSIDYLKDETTKLDNWQYGKIIETNLGNIGKKEIESKE